MDDVLLTNAVVAILLMFLTWLVSLRLHDVSIVDIVWGLGFVVISWVTFTQYRSSVDGFSILPLAMVTIWGLRLATHIALRKRAKGEDYRYRTMREQSPNTFPRDSLLRVFLLQAVLLWVVSLPLQLAINKPPMALGLLAAVGLLLWAIGFFFESVGDWQLTRFKVNPENKDKVMDRGLWRYTRHPNYFGDFCVWWAIYLFALSAGHWWTVIGPIIMTILLMKVSGAGLLEKTIGKRRPGYDEYAARTNAFFPGPAKR